MEENYSKQARERKGYTHTRQPRPTVRAVRFDKRAATRAAERSSARGGRCSLVEHSIADLFARVWFVPSSSLLAPSSGRRRRDRAARWMYTM